MHGTDSRDYLSDEFLDRVRRAYRFAVGSYPHSRGMWRDFDRRRADIHSALLHEDLSALRYIFADPIRTDLFYGVDNLCLSLDAASAPDDFLHLALDSDRGRSAQYQVGRLLELLKDSRERSVVEIGPGMGRAAYFAYCAGITDYTTIDLPLGIVAQACFLGRALGPNKLWFAGENTDSDSGCIKLLPAGRLPQRHYNVALNVDSLSEMPASDAFRYASWLSKHTVFFLSINHSRNLFTVREAIMLASNARRLFHSDCPSWPGYTEELYSNSVETSELVPWRRPAFGLLVAMRYVTRRIAARVA